MGDIEFTREEKIALLENSVVNCSRDIMYYSLYLNRRANQDKKFVENKIKKTKLEKQAFELLLYKIEKGERK